MKGLRTSLRRRRAGLSAAEIAAFSRQISHHLWQLPALARCRRIACYFAVGGEVDCLPVMQEALARGREIYLPVLHRQGMIFAPWRPASSLAANRFGIPEPAAPIAGCLRAGQLDVVLTPLVAFDSAGTRLGMGGGYYDRALACSRQRGLWQKPHIIGLGYGFQRVETLPAMPWDIALHAAVTENGAQIF